MMKLSSEDFQRLFKESGGRMTAKGRPVIDLDGIYGSTQRMRKGNRKVINATPVFDEEGNKVADSNWEYYCKTVLEDAGIEFDFQRKFELLPTIRQQGARTLSKRTWAPDFVFEKHKIVADAKGHITEMARIKIQIFLFRYPEWSVCLIKTKDDLYNFVHKIKSKENDEKKC